MMDDPRYRNVNVSPSAAPARRRPAPRLGAVVALVLVALAASLLAWRATLAPYAPARASGDEAVFLPLLFSRFSGRPGVTPSATPTHTATPTPTATPDPRLYRFGVNFIPGYGDLVDYPLGDAPFGWYSHYNFERSPQEPLGREFVQMVPVDGRWESINWSDLREAARNNPGSLWLIGNEPECNYQANLTPDVYAQRYYKSYTEIKAADPTAQVAIGGVVQPTPLRLQWLDLVRQRYQNRYGATIPVDVWNIHNMILMERAGWLWGGDPGGDRCRTRDVLPVDGEYQHGLFQGAYRRHAPVDERPRRS